MSHTRPEDAQELLKKYGDYLEKEGLRSTRQRDVIVESFFGRSDHVSVDELHEELKRQDEGLGYATVYRTLKLLVEAGLASERQFGDGLTRFEPRVGEHHDHIICVECGHIVEFHNEQIERIQETVVAEHGFALERHRHELFVRCLDRQCPRRPKDK